LQLLFSLGVYLRPKSHGDSQLIHQNLPIPNSLVNVCSDDCLSIYNSQWAYKSSAREGWRGDQGDTLDLVAEHNLNAFIGAVPARIELVFNLLPHFSHFYIGFPHSNNNYMALKFRRELHYAPPVDLADVSWKLFNQIAADERAYRKSELPW
jgi:hypothetical protein